MFGSLSLKLHLPAEKAATSGNVEKPGGEGFTHMYIQLR
jgi:hypothetical protein